MEKMTIEELEERKSAIVAELDNEDADLDALEAEMRSIKEELEKREALETKKAEIRSQVAQGAGKVEKVVEPEERKEKTMAEIRDSKEYINAYAEYVKSGDDTEVRALLTENGSGDVQVPSLVYDTVKTAWEKEGIMSRVRKSYVKGNLRVGFELSADDAVIHTEGSGAVNEEDLTLGVVSLIPQSIKKWISVSDEALDLTGEAFLQYVYDELTYRIAKKAADEVIAKIEACGTQSTDTQVGVSKIKSTTITVGLIAKALGELSDEATRPVIMMNKSTWAKFKEVQYANNYGVDPFEGLDVVFNSSIASFDAATTGVTYAIVGDLENGALANFPNGDDISIKIDDKTLMTSDLVRVLGREYVGIGIVGVDSFVKITK